MASAADNVHCFYFILVWLLKVQLSVNSCLGSAVKIMNSYLHVYRLR